MLLCKNLLDSSLANNIRPTLIVPADFKGVIPSCLNIQVFYGFIPTEIYENLLKETMFHFLSSQSVHTKVVVDCINNSIYPICLKHNAYLELGLNESNSIFLSDNTTKTLGFKSNTQDFLLTPDQVQVIVNKVKKILKCEELKSKILEYDNLQHEIQPNVNTISSLTSLNSHIASLQGKKDFSYETPYGNEEVDLSCDHFKTSPRFLLHSRFNGLSIFYNRQVYLFTRLQSYPNKISINYLKNSKVFFRNRYSIVFFKNLSEVPLALEWSSTFDSGQYLFKYPNGLKEMLKYHIQKHEFTFLMLRASYRIIKKTSRTVHRFIKS